MVPQNEAGEAEGQAPGWPHNPLRRRGRGPALPGPELSQPAAAACSSRLPTDGATAPPDPLAPCT